MHILLKDLENEWGKTTKYKDVEAICWDAKKERVEQCPEGCKLDKLKWEIVPGHDAKRQIRICHKHGFVRIYVISGSTEKASNWSPKDDSF